MPSVESFFEQCDALTSGKSHLQILQETRDLLSDERRWTKFARARDRAGRSVEVEDPEAAMWSIEGAVARVCNPFGITPISMLRLLDKVVSIVFHTREEVTANMYNDLMRHELILELLDEAIAIEEVKLGLE